MRGVVCTTSGNAANGVLLWYLELHFSPPPFRHLSEGGRLSIKFKIETARRTFKNADDNIQIKNPKRLTATNSHNGYSNMRSFSCPSILIFSTVLLLFSAREAPGQDVLRLANDPWPPYTGETLPGKGIATEIVVTALHRAGYETQVTFVPWKRALEGTFDGTYDILITTSYNDERAKKVAYSDPYLSNVVRLIKRKDSAHKFNSIEDIRGLTVGVSKGYIYEPEFDEATFFIKDNQGESVLANLKKLQAGRLDLIAEDELVVKYFLKENFSSEALEVNFLPKPLNTKNLHIIIRKSHINNTRIIEGFTQA